MKKTNGFTLIELVVVIVILGILAVIAAPKFMNLQKDARIAALKGLEGSFKAANDMVFTKATLKGIENLEFYSSYQPIKNQIQIDGGFIDLHYGYILPKERNLKNILNLGDDWNIIGGGNSYRNTIYIFPKTVSVNTSSLDKIKKSKCYLAYDFYHYANENGIHHDVTKPHYNLQTLGC